MNHQSMKWSSLFGPMLCRYLFLKSIKSQILYTFKILITLPGKVLNFFEISKNFKYSLPYSPPPTWQLWDLGTKVYWKWVWFEVWFDFRVIFWKHWFIQIESLLLLFIRQIVPMVGGHLHKTPTKYMFWTHNICFVTFYYSLKDMRMAMLAYEAWYKNKGQDQE
jgi:hypothetical protein